jgi:hypothetical protein
MASLLTHLLLATLRSYSPEWSTAPTVFTTQTPPRVSYAQRVTLFTTKQSTFKRLHPG